MIVVDTSALMAVLKNESDAEIFAALMHSAEQLVIGTPTKFEFFMVATSSAAREGGEQRARTMLQTLAIGDVQWDERHVDLATTAFHRFGKGRHPAKLNFGDCMAYAVARSLDAPLPFKGEDFALTDVKRVTG